MGCLWLKITYKTALVAENSQGIALKCLIVRLVALQDSLASGKYCVVVKEAQVERVVALMGWRLLVKGMICVVTGICSMLQFSGSQGQGF